MIKKGQILFLIILLVPALITTALPAGIQNSKSTKHQRFIATYVAANRQGGKTGGPAGGGGGGKGAPPNTNTTTTTTTTATTTTLQKQSSAGQTCFQMVYKGNTYDGCTDVDSPGAPWCATSVNPTTKAYRSWNYC